MSEILKVLNRPSQKREQDKQAEQREKKKGLWIVRNIKWVMFLFFNSVAFLFDALAVTTVYTLTYGDVLLSALALLPTGVPMLMWEGGWLYPLASPDQKRRAIWGIVLAVFSAVVVGVLAIVANQGGGDVRVFVSIGMLAWCVITVIIHGYWAALYFYKDPVIQRDHELQVTIAGNEYQRDSLQETESLLKDVETILTREKELKERFGEGEVNRALELILGIDLNGDGKIAGRPIQPKQNAAMPAMATDVKREQINPTQGREQ